MNDLQVDRAAYGLPVRTPKASAGLPVRSLGKTIYGAVLMTSYYCFMTVARQCRPWQAGPMTGAPPPLRGTLESALYATDLDAATDFWRNVIGLVPFQHVPGRHVFFRISGDPPQVLLVFDPRATEKPPVPDARLPVPPHGARGPGHFCLAAAPESLNDWRAHLQRHGIAIEADFHWPNGARSIYFRDPAGNSIELADPAIWT